MLNICSADWKHAASDAKTSRERLCQRKASFLIPESMIFKNKTIQCGVQWNPFVRPSLLQQRSGL